MTAPTAHLSPTAGLFNALTRLAIARLSERATELRVLIGIETELNHQLNSARNFADSKAAGYIDRTGLEA